MKKLFFLLACVVMSVLSYGQDNQLVWANGRLLYGTPIVGMDSLTYDDMEDVDTLHLLLPRTLIKVVHDTVYIHDTVYVETDCGGEDDTPSAGIGVFSVSADKQVTFSQGNLQYTQSTNTWSFAENQWDLIGNANVIDGALADKIDLFGWSADNTTAPFGVSTSEDNNDYVGSFVDWGTNKIGDDAPNTWRTLTKDEWVYLFHDRQNAENLIAYGTIEDIRGIIILPDNWSTPDGLNFVAESTNGMIWNESYYDNTSGNGNYSNVYNAKDWLLMEKNGAIFLPAAGVKEHGIANFAGHNGIYWSSTLYDNTNAYHVHFAWNYIRPQNYYYKSNGLSVRLVKDIEGGGTTPDTPTEPEEPENTENGHEYVDLGLSVKWATMNVGASKPEEYGDYFAWGVTQPKDTYNWSTYKWCNGSSHTLTKYCTDNNYGTVDNKTVLDAADDAATANWGGSWRMPTDAELTELCEQCTWTWTTQNGVYGYKVTSKKSGYTNESIFLPAGHHYMNLLGYADILGNYWSSSLNSVNPNEAYYLNFRSDYVSRIGYDRYRRLSVRPVCQ